MKIKLTRRDFVKGSTAIGVGLTAMRPLNAVAGLGQAASAARQVVVSSANGLPATEKAMQLIKAGKDTLDAVIAGVNIVEDDPEDNSVGYGGLPNAEGDVELDASVMHGPTHRAGAVASLKHIKNPSKVARLIMERTDHVLLVGEGALRFALAHGFEKTNLLTEKSRIAWLKWKESLSPNDAWGPGLQNQGVDSSELTDPKLAEYLAFAREVIANPPTGTITCLALNERGDLSGVTTTSGLAWKIPGRVGDSPLIGCGLFVDNEVGAAGSTGRGEEVIKINGSRIVVENMKRGLSPKEACLDALGRIAANFNNDKNRLRRFNVNFYCVNKKGEHAGASLWKRYDSATKKTLPARYAVHDGKRNYLADSAAYFDEAAREG